MSFMQVSVTQEAEDRFELRAIYDGEPCNGAIYFGQGEMMTLTDASRRARNIMVRHMMRDLSDDTVRAEFNRRFPDDTAKLLAETPTEMPAGARRPGAAGFIAWLTIIGLLVFLAVSVVSLHVSPFAQQTLILDIETAKQFSPNATFEKGSK
jgi:hypothetical protein